MGTPVARRGADVMLDTTEAMIGWSATCGGLLVLVAASVPFVQVALPLAVGVIALSVVTLVRHTGSDSTTAAHGLAGLAMSVVGVGIVISLALTGQPAGPSILEPPSIKALRPVDATASSFANPSRDGTGRLLTFDAANTIDGNPATAWRVKGRGVGETLAVAFDRPVHLTSIGMVPGWAAIDDVSRANRFVENKRVTRARFVFTDGSAVDFTYSDAPVMQHAVVDVDTTGVVMQILASGPRTKRNYTAISDLEFLGWTTG
jgi:hypothetical protein